MKKFLGFVILCVGGLFIFSALVSGRHEQAEQAAPAQNQYPDTPHFTEKVPDDPPIQINAPYLYAAYKDNEIAADQIYKGKILEVSGTVGRIRKDFADNAILELMTQNQFESVDAYLKADSVSFAATLSPGNSVTVLCRGAGLMIGSPMLKDCSIK
jgi:hypothetical protein